MRGIAIALVVLAACGKSAHERAATHDAGAGKVPVDATRPTDARQSPEPPLTATSTDAEIDARYALAAQHANEPLGLALLEDVARVDGDVDRARWDDAWAAQWDTEAFRAVLATTPDLWRDERDAGVEESETAPPRLACPAGTSPKGKWKDGEGAMWCARPDGTRQGPSLDYQTWDNGDGERRLEGAYLDGKKHGLWTEEETSAWDALGGYVAGARHGLWESANMEYQTRFEVYVGGERHGRTVLLAEDGHVIAEGGYDHGQLHGAFRYYDQAGTLLGETTLDHGNGTWIAFADGPTPTQEGQYAKGKRVGPWQFHRDDGTLQAAGGFAVGQLEGEWKIYDDDGQQVRQTLQFAADKLIKADGERADHVAFDAAQFAEDPEVVDAKEEEDVE